MGMKVNHEKQVAAANDVITALEAEFSGEGLTCELRMHAGGKHQRSVSPALQNHLSGEQPILLSISWVIWSSKCSSIWRLMRKLGLSLSSLGQKL